MKKYFAFGMIGLILGACEKIPKSAIDMTCDRYSISASIYSDRLEATINNQEHVFKKIDTRSGVKYQSINQPLLGAILWDKGDTWSLFPKGAKEEIICNIIVHDIGTQVVQHWTIFN